jgi:Na+-driven multidrug efflux pump
MEPLFSFFLTTKELFEFCEGLALRLGFFALMIILAYRYGIHIYRHMKVGDNPDSLKIKTLFKLLLDIILESGLLIIGFIILFLFVKIYHFMLLLIDNKIPTSVLTPCNQNENFLSLK